jgi:hypothetical protein
VLEVNRYFAQPINADSEPPPWHEYRNLEAAQAMLQHGDDSLGAELASELGFEHARRNGDGKKKALHTTTISGRSDAEDPRAAWWCFTAVTSADSATYSRCCCTSAIPNKQR